MTAAPPKPAFGAPCNGCGACCRAVPCLIARDLLGAFDAPCPALEFDAGRYWCGLVRNPAAHILALRGHERAGAVIRDALLATGYFGIGCDSTGDDDQASNRLKSGREN